MSHDTNEAGDRPVGDRSRDRCRCPLRLRRSGCRLWSQRIVSLGARGSQARLSGWHSSPPQGLVEVQLIWPRAVRGRPRQRYIPDVLSIPAEKMFGKTKMKLQTSAISNRKNRQSQSAPIHPIPDPQSMAYAVILSFGSSNKPGLKFLFSAN